MFQMISYEAPSMATTVELKGEIIMSRTPSPVKSSNTGGVITPLNVSVYSARA